MKPITMFVTSWCPYCKNALLVMQQLQKENPDYAHIEIKVIDEELEPVIAKKYDYYYVPTYYLGDQKLHEGAASKETIMNVFDKALSFK